MCSQKPLGEAVAAFTVNFKGLTFLKYMYSLPAEWEYMYRVWKREGKIKTVHICMCTHTHTLNTPGTHQSEFMLGWGKFFRGATKYKYFQVYTPTHIFICLENVHRRKRLCVCVLGERSGWGGLVAICIPLLKKFLSADHHFMKCNKHLKILSSSLYTPICFYGSKPEYNDEP